MKYKAVIFDLYETLITEWGHKKYTKSEMSSDLGIDSEKFDLYWDEKEEDRYMGKINFTDSILYVVEKCGGHIESPALSRMVDKRIETKSQCFEYVNPDIYRLLEELKRRELRLAVISNCSSDEVQVIRQTKIYGYFDQITLSYEVGMKKPDHDIYKKCCDLLGVDTNECIQADFLLHGILAGRFRKGAVTAYLRYGFFKKGRACGISGASGGYQAPRPQ